MSPKTPLTSHKSEQKYLLYHLTQEVSNPSWKNTGRSPYKAWRLLRPALQLRKHSRPSHWLKTDNLNRNQNVSFYGVPLYTQTSLEEVEDTADHVGMSIATVPAFGPGYVLGKDQY